MKAPPTHTFLLKTCDITFILDRAFENHNSNHRDGSPGRLEERTIFATRCACGFLFSCTRNKKCQQLHIHAFRRAMVVNGPHKSRGCMEGAVRLYAATYDACLACKTFETQTPRDSVETQFLSQVGPFVSTFFSCSGSCVTAPTRLRCSGWMKEVLMSFFLGCGGLFAPHLFVCFYYACVLRYVLWELCAFAFVLITRQMPNLVFIEKRLVSTARGSPSVVGVVPDFLMHYADLVFVCAGEKKQ